MSPDSCVLHVSLVLYYAKEFFWGIAFLKAKIFWISTGLHGRSYFGGVQLTVENWGYQIQTWRVFVSASRQDIELQLSGMSLIIMQLFGVELIYHASPSVQIRYKWKPLQIVNSKFSYQYYSLRWPKRGTVWGRFLYENWFASFACEPHHHPIAKQ